MLNHKAKAHRGRGSKGQDRALCIVDTFTIPSKVYACMIANKSAESILLIIKIVVRPCSIIHTDLAKVYKISGDDKNYEHSSVIHKC